MHLNRKIFLLGIFLIFITLFGVYATSNYQSDNSSVIVNDYSNSTDVFGCCSIVLQLDANDTLFAYRRDSNLTADIYIEKITWHGIPALKQYKTEGGYFNHVIVTNNGWVIGLGGIDDGADNEKCENITAGMISDDYSISKKALKEIQKIKKPYGKGHVLIKAPNGNYGFATVDKLKTGNLKPGKYISLPNNYSLSRSGEFSLDTSDKVKLANKLAQSDKYGLDRREIITYDFHVNGTNNVTDVYVSNEDGSKLNVSYVDCIDDVYFDGTLISAEDIPIAPDYKKIGSITFSGETSNVYKFMTLLVIVITAFIVAIVSYISYSIVKFIKFRKRR